ncbi:response regulator transcription factor [uncultured Massilia sp.]|uniref:response regulator transcription factor n=1 Tax=uncultured Massilia sp. TaxID=169973 RepID=UPI0025CBC015|nr:response regulator transcription factor [uncultured Massilia sp.]
MKILMVEDDLSIGRALLSVFQDHGHGVVWCRLAAHAMEKTLAEHFDAMLLDLGLPDGDGTDLLREMRARRNKLPVLIITARDSLEDRLKGFDLGADDYLIKPFDIPELLVRLRAIVRRASGTVDSGEQLWQVGELVLDEGSMRVTRAGSPVALSPTEYALLLTLVKQAGRVLTRADLERRVLPHSEGQTLDVHIYNLRRKIGEGMIRTVRGVGYVIQREAA